MLEGYVLQSCINTSDPQLIVLIDASLGINVATGQMIHHTWCLGFILMSVNVTLPVQGTRMYQSAVIRTFGNSSKSGWHLVPGIRRESIVESQSLTPILVPPTSPKKQTYVFCF